jgi:preprotein translocase subunit SecE
MKNITTYLKESYRELSEKVTWPSWPQLQQSTMIVLAASLLFTFIVFGMDFVASNGLKFVYNILYK